MAALELISGRFPASAAADSDITMASGDSLTIRNAAQDSNIWLVQVWGDSDQDTEVRIRSPMLHDNVDGIRLKVEAGQIDPLLPDFVIQRLFPQDTLTVNNADAIGSTNFLTYHMLVYYENLPGIDARFIDLQTLREKARHVTVIRNSLALTASSNYTGAEAINADVDLLRANTDYAILGYLVDTPIGAVRYRGVDFGSLGIGGPGNVMDRDMTANWFLKLTGFTGIPLIPVFNSANKAGVQIDGLMGETGGTVEVSTIVAQLAG